MAVFLTAKVSLGTAYMYEDHILMHSCRECQGVTRRFLHACVQQAKFGSRTGVRPHVVTEEE